MKNITCLLAGLLLSAGQLWAAAGAPSLSMGKEGRLIYTADDRGNRVPDYSYAGYRMSEQPLPELPVKAVVPCQDGDATARIQAAIDYVSRLEPDENGHRGAVLLEKGRYTVEGSLKISVSGVVLRGSGAGPEGTELFGAGDDRTVLIRMAGTRERRLGAQLELSEAVSTGSMSVKAAGHSFRAGDDILITRIATAEWITQMGMDDFGGESSYIGWKPGDATRPSDVNLRWQRRVVRVEGDELFLEAPITCEIALGDGRVQSFASPGRIRETGVENLSLRSAFDEANPKDENHRWMAIEVDDVENAWVRRVDFRHFAGSAVFITDNSRLITVMDCRSYSPVSEIAGHRRYTFHTLGGQCLFLRLYSEQGMHDFSTGRQAPGPNAFVQCTAMWPNHFSGSADSWATGILFDMFSSTGHGLSYANRGQDGMGAGWTAANSMMWNCSAAYLAAPNPPTAYNWASGSWGTTYGNIDWVNSGGYSKPLSLFFAQLSERLGRPSPEEANLMPFDTQSASNPPVAKAQEFVREARRPALQLTEWIDTLCAREPLNTALPAKAMLTCWQPKAKKAAKPAPKPRLEVKDGIVSKNGRFLFGRSQGVVWWNGSLKDRYLAVSAAPHITRWAPGRTGTGFTDDLDELTDRMVSRHTLAVNHYYALWYDRRRDDHERIQRMDGYVWEPFYELPFARSGQGLAWDGLSKYDLTKWNVWYWNRLKAYADLADEKGLLLYQQHYFQHNILEAGAHWADFPWRTANNVNGTGFPEPVPYALDKRIYMAEQFYDVQDPVRRELHRGYIRKCLENFADNQCVIHFIGEEFTGPLHFVEFWLDVIAEWEAETGHDAIVALSVTKDVQDAILEDPVRSRTVDIIDVRFWSITMNGFYAPPGGKNMAPRQFQRLRGNSLNVTVETQARNMEERVYEVVNDYRSRYPDKAMICSGGDAWVPFMAGASLCGGLPFGLPDGFLRLAAQSHTLEGTSGWWRGKPGLGYIAYTHGEAEIDLTTDKKTYWAQWLNPRSGQPEGEPFTVKGGRRLKVQGNGILWLSR